MKVLENREIGIDVDSKSAKGIILVLLFVLLYGLQGVSVYQVNLVPFGVSIILALFYVRFNGYVLGGVYFASFLLAQGFSVLGVLKCLIVSLVICVLQYLKEKKKWNVRRAWVFGVGVAVGVVVAIFDVSSFSDVLPVGVAIILGELFLYSSLIFFDATINKGLLSQINLDEKVCGGIILIIFGIGISKAWVGVFAFGLMIAIAGILIINRVVGACGVIITSALLGIGFSIAYMNPLYISLFVLLGLVAISFKCRWRILSAIGVSVAYIGFVFLFDSGYVMGEIVGVVVGAVVYMLVPKKLIQNFSSVFVGVRTLSYQRIFRNAQEELSSRVKKLSDIFSEMDSVYRKMVKGSLSDKKAKELIKEETIDMVCQGCANKDRCFRGASSFMDNCFDILVDSAYERSKILLIDVPEYVTTNCARVNQIILSLNHIVSSYNEYRQSVSNIDTSRILIAEQLCGVSKLLEALSRNVGTVYSFDENAASNIKESLGYAGIVCADVTVCNKSPFGNNINLIVNNNNNIDKNIEKIVSKSIKHPYRIVKKELCGVANSLGVVLESLPKYDIAFGISKIAKNRSNISGDQSSVLDIGDGKYLVVISDGMGSGEDASEISGLTIKLIEHFYKAGFDNDIILSSVNKLLSLGETERFSTIDICAIDVRAGVYDFIKLSASEGYIRHSNGDVETIFSSGLPIGVLESVRPHITKKMVSAMDTVVMVSDGVSDVLGNEIKKIIEVSDISNPQLLADAILQSALDRSNQVPADDMTVVCVRVFENLI